jgi:F420-dependent oxidoreductase-like protein
MRLGVILGYSGASANWDLSLVQEAEALGYAVAWSSEAYGSDAVVPLAMAAGRTQTIHLGTGIMQMPARTPACTAMTAMTFDQLTQGRFILGLGMSGPQVVEGWHGVPYGKLLRRTREYISILRRIFAREAPLEHHGPYYDIPYTGADATGLGKPLKSIIHGRKDIPIYLAAIGPKNTALAAEIADGWIPTQFAAEHFHVFEPHLMEGIARRTDGKTLKDLDICASVSVALGKKMSDLQACLDSVKPRIALYVGGMGARGKNFYFDLACRYGYEAAARKIQDLYLAGRKEEAAAAVPNALADQIALCGPKERIKERLEPWKKAPLTTLNLRSPTREALRMMPELL